MILREYLKNYIDQSWGNLDIVILSLPIFVSLFFFFSLILDMKVLFVHPEYYKEGPGEKYKYKKVELCL